MARSGDQPIAYEFHAAYNGRTYPLRADFDAYLKELGPEKLQAIIDKWLQ